MSDGAEMVKRETWDTLRANGLLWWANRVLHVFGWAIVTVVEGHDENGNGGVVTDAYPARVRFRGFDEKTESAEFVKVSEWMKREADTLLGEARE